MRGSFWGALLLAVSLAAGCGDDETPIAPDSPVDCSQTDGGVEGCEGEVDAEVPLPLPSARSLIRPADPCPPHPPMEGEVIEVGPDAAARLSEIINGAAPGTTIALADGTYSLTEEIVITAPDVTVRGASGNRDAVILDLGYERGSVMGVRAANVRLIDMTLTRGYFHGVHVRPAPGAMQNVPRPVLYNLRVIDNAQQQIKINQENDIYIDNGLVACSEVGLTDAGRAAVRNNCYTGGVDAHRTRGWHIRDNVFSGFWCDVGLSEHAVHFWQTTAATLIERNQFWDNARAIGLGMAEENETPREFDDLDCEAVGYVDDFHGIVVNNVIADLDPRPYQTGGGVEAGIALWNACAAQVMHNTIVRNGDAFAGIDLRWGGTYATVKNNLLTGEIVEREAGRVSASGNAEMADLSVFTDAMNRDFRLAEGSMTAPQDVTATAHPDATRDANGVSRPGRATPGAYERPVAAMPE